MSGRPAGPVLGQRRTLLAGSTTGGGEGAADACCLAATAPPRPLHLHPRLPHLVRLICLATTHRACLAAELSRKIVDGLGKIKMIDRKGNVREDPRWAAPLAAWLSAGPTTKQHCLACSRTCCCRPPPAPASYLQACLLCGWLAGFADCCRLLARPPAVLLPPGCRYTKRPWLRELQKAVPDLGGRSELDGGRAIPVWPENPDDVDSRAVSDGPGLAWHLPCPFLLAAFSSPRPHSQGTPQASRARALHS